MHPNPGTVGAWFLRKLHLQLYAYPVILNIFVVPDDAQYLVKSQKICRVLIFKELRCPDNPTEGLSSKNEIGHTLCPT